MKRYFYIIAAILFTAVAICLTSCKDTEDEPAPEKQPSILGIWVFSKQTMQKYSINRETGEEEVFYNYVDEGEEGFREFWTFKDAGNSSGFLEIASAPYTAVEHPYDYDKSKKEITFEPGDPYYEIVYKVTKLTLEEMTLYYDDWDEKENYGDRHIIELTKWWTDL